MRRRTIEAMPRHESVTDEYVARLDASFLAAAEWVRSAPDWPETQRRMQGGTYTYIVAMQRVEMEWSATQIENELSIRLTFGNMPGAKFIPGE
jgi:hypothetical protein